MTKRAPERRPKAQTPKQGLSSVTDNLKALGETIEATELGKTKTATVERRSATDSDGAETDGANGEDDTGDGFVAPTSDNSPTDALRVREETKSDFTNRHRRAKTWDAVSEQMGEWRIAARAEGASQSEARSIAWDRAVETYPPPEPEPKLTTNDQFDPSGGDSGLPGLSDIPPGWGVLPAATSLENDIGWAQSERLRVVSGDVVTLSNASCPAPSMAALAWIETSCKAYTLFCQAVLKVSSTGADDTEVAKRETKSIAEVRALLSEMVGG